MTALTEDQQRLVAIVRQRLGVDSSHFTDRQISDELSKSYAKAYAVAASPLNRKQRRAYGKK